MSATKIDFKREMRQLYSARRTPELVDVPELTFLIVDGQGSPETALEFRAAIEALYTMAYTIKFALKRQPDGIDYRVMPLEGLFWVRGDSEFPPKDPSRWEWSAMIMQPAPVSAELLESARNEAAAKKALPALELVRLDRIHEGAAAQILHVGPYAQEPPTIARLHEFIAGQGYELTGKHHEIYLGDPNRSRPETLKTVIRQPVRLAGSG